MLKTISWGEAIVNLTTQQLQTRAGEWRTLLYLRGPNWHHPQNMDTVFSTHMSGFKISYTFHICLTLTFKIHTETNTWAFENEWKKLPWDSFSLVPFLSPSVLNGDLPESHPITSWHSVLQKVASGCHFVLLKSTDTFHCFLPHTFRGKKSKSLRAEPWRKKKNCSKEVAY